MFHPSQIGALATLRVEERLHAAGQRRLARLSAAPRPHRPAAVVTFPAARWFATPADAVARGPEAQRCTGIGTPAPGRC